uniref:Uncharacterized protein n=1 Tax=Salix viminalis TaxID=40686 RepID=A0A6N2L2V4_SALVM
MPMSPATTFLPPPLPPPSSSYAADEISTESYLCQAQRSSIPSSMKEALEGELELGHQRTVVVAPPEKAAKASTESAKDDDDHLCHCCSFSFSCEIVHPRDWSELFSVLANTLPLQYARPGLLSSTSRSMPMSPATTFLPPPLPPPSSSYAADEISTESYLCQAQRSSMKHSKVNWSSGHQRTVVVAPPEKAAKASTSVRVCQAFQLCFICMLLRQDELQNFGREERSG